MGKNYFTGTFIKGYQTNMLIGKEVCIDGEKKGVVVEYNPETGDIKIEVQKTFYDAILEKMGETPIGVSSRRCINNLCSKHKEIPTIESIKAMIDQLSNEEREELFSNYCKGCGCKDPNCQCQNDE